jgi:sortase
MSRFRPGSRLLTILIAGLLAIGGWQVWEGSWIYAKARLAQVLLQRAWSRALAGEAMPKPWPWADTWPVARLRMQHPSVDLIVLAGASGRTLAFGPGHVTSSALPGQEGTVMLTGHRDTHFRFLRAVTPGRSARPDGKRRDHPALSSHRTASHGFTARAHSDRSRHRGAGAGDLFSLRCDPSRRAATLRGAGRAGPGSRPFLTAVGDVHEHSPACRSSRKSNEKRPAWREDQTTWKGLMNGPA